MNEMKKKISLYPKSPDNVEIVTASLFHYSMFSTVHNKMIKTNTPHLL